MEMRDLHTDDLPALESAIARDTFHPGEWKTKHFFQQPPDEEYQPAVHSQVIENKNGPIAFVRFTKTLRISCVWNDTEDTSRNAKAVIFGITEAVKQARGSGFSEVVINSKYQKLSDFLVNVMKMTKRGDDHLLLL